MIYIYVYIYIYVCVCVFVLINVAALAQASDFRIEKLSSSGFEAGKSQAPDWMPTHKPTELSRIKLKTWTQQPVPMMS